jgi:hypothetical protein
MRRFTLIVALAALLPGLWLSMCLLRRKSTTARRVLGAVMYVTVGILLMELILAELRRPLIA